MIKRNVVMALLIAMSFTIAGCGKANEPEIGEAVTVESSSEATIEPVKEEPAKAEAEEEKKDTEKATQPEADPVEQEKKEAETPKQEETQKQEAEAPKQAEAQKQNADAQNQESSAEPEKPAGYGRILFCGDSRTVDLFSEPSSEIRNEVHDGIPVYCRDACKFEYMVDAINEYGIDNFDTLLSWMGCNNYGDFSQYGPYYDQLLSQGKKLVLCTVGPTADPYLDGDFDKEYYTNARQINYNNSLKAWAKDRNVKVIDLYSYLDQALNDQSGITISQADGIHYYPQPNPVLWNYILSNLQ